jgi:hypothetical protein
VKKILSLMLFVLTCVSPAHAIERNKVELDDGSTLEVEILNFSEGQYTVRSPNLGVFQIEEAKVLNIHRIGSNEVAPVSPDAAALQAELQKIQPAITGDPGIMSAIVALFSDPVFQALFKDPEIMKAVRSLDFKALTANEKFIKAMNHPTVQSIRQKIKGS